MGLVNVGERRSPVWSSRFLTVPPSSQTAFRPAAARLWAVPCAGGGRRVGRIAGEKSLFGLKTPDIFAL